MAKKKLNTNSHKKTIIVPEPKKCDCGKGDKDCTCDEKHTNNKLIPILTKEQRFKTLLDIDNKLSGIVASDVLNENTADTIGLFNALQEIRQITDPMKLTTVSNM